MPVIQTLIADLENYNVVAIKGRKDITYLLSLILQD